jgi:hypothetical protein
VIARTPASNRQVFIAKLLHYPKYHLMLYLETKSCLIFCSRSDRTLVKNSAPSKRELAYLGKFASVTAKSVQHGPACISRGCGVSYRSKSSGFSLSLVRRDQDH